MKNLINHLRKHIFHIRDEHAFGQRALEVFRLQAEHNPVYKKYISLLGKDPRTISHIRDIPFLPVSFFKDHTVSIFPGSDATVFSSSGTTGSRPSQHAVPDLSLYEESFTRSFEHFYGEITSWCILALLPSYLERSGSSLVYMLDHMIKKTGCPHSGFYLYDHDRLYRTLLTLAGENRKVLLFGVSFALLDFAGKYELPPMDLTVMETGGMKGRRKEMVREELHTVLSEKFHVPVIHSEYGMTELLSQAYSRGHGIFHTPPWMRIVVRDSYDPFARSAPGQTGGINVIDLANIHSCAFIETQDLGRLLPKGGFTVEGRYDHSDIRGCNLMVQEI